MRYAPNAILMYGLRRAGRTRYSFYAFFAIQAAQECFTQDRRLRRPRKKHNGVQRSTKKKGSKCRAAYALRGVNGQVASPLCARAVPTTARDQDVGATCVAYACG